METEALASADAICIVFWYHKWWVVDFVVGFRHFKLTCSMVSFKTFGEILEFPPESQLTSPGTNPHFWVCGCHPEELQLFDLPMDLERLAVAGPLWCKEIPSTELTYPTYPIFKGTFEAEFPVPKMGYVNSSEGRSQVVNQNDFLLSGVETDRI